MNTKNLPKKSSIIYRFRSKKKMQDLATEFKAFLKSLLSTSLSLTYSELQTKIKRKHIDENLKQKICSISQVLEKKQYSRHHATKKELSALKKECLALVREMYPEDKKKDPPMIKKITSSIFNQKKRKQKAKSIVEKKKAEINKGVKKSLNSAKLSLEKDPEVKEIKKFISISLEAGVKKSDLIKELKAMGFKKRKIDFSMKK